MSGSSSTTRMRSPVTARGTGAAGALAAGGAVMARRRVEPAPDVGDDHVDGDRVVAAARHDHVGIALARLDELQVHRLDGSEVLVEDFVERAAALGHVAANAADEADVGVGVDEDLHVAEIAHTRVSEQEDAVDRRRRRPAGRPPFACAAGG